ncbi:TPA: Mor transcription activator family protein [Klebsiella pneumoniae]|uniref:Mor transcription activator family protein n=1 Tax=Klebsiella pneumoniae TaxID=573 RepID=UPI001648C6C3|nr:Mor transcription activator family protein [Klebsiella pneumoniae]EKW2891627.1 positive regulator of late transcription [Klebsiella pneumoniae]ELA0627886.1 positive regulator of late transcription [Klebsiella pneumoniae]MBC4125408.1 transcriptional regulator [Klebsiella pneumoniae]MBX4703656.1 transcriptional regulator [Klebsiella pneumoniae]MCD9656168.1 positive regulator of late transcription [Klebsiella pneumoniae]
MDNNLQLFDDDPQLAGLLGQLDQIPLAELERHWPERLAELLAVLVAELRRNDVPPEQARELGAKLAAAIGHYLGGRAVYIPAGDRLFIALRDNLIYAAFQGNNHDELARQFDLSVPALYRIIAEQRRIWRRRRQSDLFENV